MPEVARRQRRPAWTARSRRVAPAALVALLSVGLRGGVARADSVDACISAAEQSQVERRDAHLRAAHDRLLFCARDACPAAIQKDCKRWLAEVEAMTPTIVLHAVDTAGRDVARVRVVVDGVRLPDALDGRAMAVDPGEHVFRFEAGKRVVVQRFVIREGERDRLLSLKLPDEGPSSPTTRVPAGAWVLGGLGAAALTAGVALWVQGRSDRADLYATCGVKHDCAPSSVDHARSLLVGGDVAAGVGLAALGAAVWWALAAPSPRLPVDAHPVAGGGVLRWQGAF